MALPVALLTLAGAVAGQATAAAGATTARHLVTVTGSVRLVAVDAFTALRSPRGAVVSRFDRLGPAPGGRNVRVQVQVGGRVLTVPAAPAGTALQAGLRSGDPVAVTLSVPAGAGPARVVSVGRQAAAGYATARSSGAGLLQHQITGPGDHGLMIVPIFWSAHRQPTRAELARLDPLPALLGLGRATAAYWSGQSAGAIRIHPSVLPWVRVPVPHGCDENELLDLAMEAWRTRPSSDPFQHVMVYFPARGDCGFAGLGVIGGNVIWVNGTLAPNVGAHEIGHNFGLGHARSALCRAGAARVPLSGSCALAEYGDSADVMGGGFGSLNSSFADYLGLATVVPAETGRTRRVTLAPLSAVTAVRAVRISVPQGYVYLDYRPGGDGPAAWSGVQAHYLPSTLVPYSELLDLPSDSTAPFSRVSLPALAVWRVPGAPVAVRLESVGPRGATVVVEPTGTDGAAPAMADATVPQSGHRYPSAVPLRWTPPPAVARAVAQTVYLDDVPVRRLPPTVSALTLAAVPRGRHRVQVAATDQAGNVGRTRAVEFDVDPSLSDPPPLTLRPTAGEVQNDSVSVAWGLVAAGRTARLLVDGVPVAAGLRGGRHTLTGVADGSHQLVVQTMAGGRVVAASDPVPFVVDAVAPAAPAGLAWRSGRLSFARAGDLGSGLQQYRLTVDGGPVRLVPGGYVGALVPLTDGPHTLTLVAEDRVGNLSAPAVLPVLADASPPERAVVTSPATGWLTTDRTVSVLVTLPQDPHSGVARTWLSVNGRVLPDQPVDRGDGTAQFDVPLGRGLNVLRVSAVNGLGLRSDSAPVTVRVL